MQRQKRQRPEVYPTGKREKLWKVEYREYFIDADGKEKSRHKSATWSRSDHTKSEAQAKADALMLAMRQGTPKADGSMTLAAFWDQIYYPIRSRRWTGNTPRTVAGLWSNHIKPKFGSIPLKDFTKAAIEIHLGSLADAGLGVVTVDSVRIRLNSIFEEALDNEFIPKNPCRKVETPPCKASEETRSLTEAEVRKLWDGTEGRDHMFWRIMILTGARIGEVLALTRDDLQPDGLLIDETSLDGSVKLPKCNKIRTAALPDSLRGEIEEWLGSHNDRLMFPNRRGDAYRRGAVEIQEMEERGRTAAGNPDLTFRMCRTTFATLFEGDEADRTSIMGHHSTKFTLEHYRKPLQERRKRSVEDLDRRLRTKVVEIGKRAG